MPSKDNYSNLNGICEIIRRAEIFNPDYSQIFLIELKTEYFR